jgi:hypothetical protein
MKRVAAQDAPERQIEALENPVFFHGFFGILRTGWGETAAVAEKRADGHLIEAKDQNNEFAHKGIIP